MDALEKPSAGWQGVSRMVSWSSEDMQGDSCWTTDGGLDNLDMEMLIDTEGADSIMRDDYNSGDVYDRMNPGASSSGLSSARSSPIPSFVKAFGWCTCEECGQRVRESMASYPPDIREAKLRQYDKWSADCLKAIEDAWLRRKERYTTHLVLRRKRGLDVVGEMFGLSEAAVRAWDEGSYGRWWEGVEGDVNTTATLGYDTVFDP